LDGTQCRENQQKKLSTWAGEVGEDNTRLKDWHTSEEEKGQKKLKVYFSQSRFASAEKGGGETQGTSLQEEERGKGEVLEPGPAQMRGGKKSERPANRNDFLINAQLKTHKKGKKKKRKAVLGTTTAGTSGRAEGEGAFQSRKR